MVRRRLWFGSHWLNRGANRTIGLIGTPEPEVEGKAHRRRLRVETKSERRVEESVVEPGLIFRGGHLGDRRESLTDGRWQGVGRFQESGEGIEENVVREVRAREGEIAGFQIVAEMIEELTKQWALDLLEDNRVGEQLRSGHTSLSFSGRRSSRWGWALVSSLDVRRWRWSMNSDRRLRGQFGNSSLRAIR